MMISRRRPVLWGVSRGQLCLWPPPLPADLFFYFFQGLTRTLGVSVGLTGTGTGAARGSPGPRPSGMG